MKHGWLVAPIAKESIPLDMSETSRKSRKAMAYTIQAELMNFGYMLSSDALDLLAHQEESWQVKFHNEVIGYVRYILGDGCFLPLYDGFPKQVMKLSDVELFLNALRHYDSEGTWIPNLYTQQRPTAFEHTQYAIISPATDMEFMGVFTQILSANQSITPNDRAILEWFVKEYSSERERSFNPLDNYLPDAVPFKENLCFVMAKFGMVPRNATITDVLRMVVYLCGGDVSLPAGQKIRIKLTRSQRKMVMETIGRLLVHTSDLLVLKKEIYKINQEMKRHKNLWKRVCEVLHPSSRYSEQAFMVLYLFHRDKEIRTWDSLVENAENIEEQMALLAQRPGEFARRLDSLLRKSVNPKAVYAEFSACAERVSNKVLFELYVHFENRREAQHQRTIFIKGCRRPVKLEALPAMSKGMVDNIQSIIEDAIKKKFSKFSPMAEYVIIDERLMNIPLPTNMRTMSESTRPVPRGMRILLNNPEAKVIRFYVHWMDENGTQDIDLSATLYGLGICEQVSFNTNYVLTSDKIGSGDKGLYTLMRMRQLLNIGDASVFVSNEERREVIAVHSGDVRCRRGDCAEYIDIDIANARRYGIRYVVVDVRNYNNRSLASLSPSFGYMEREHPEANPQWIPVTVTDSFRLTSEAKTCIAVLFDVDSMEYIMVDIDSNCIAATDDGETLLTALQMYIRPPKPSVYDLIKWHVHARGGIVVKSRIDLPILGKDYSEQEFCFEDFSTSYMETMKYMADSPQKI